MGSNGVCFADKTTDELLCEFQNGGGELAFEEIVRRYAGMVYTVCLQVTRDVHDAEDATQAAFLTLALRAKTAESNIKYLGPWLQKVARRLSLDIMRAKKRRKTREEKRGAMVREMQPDRDPRKGLDRGEMADIVRDELSKLPAKYRLPLILHYFGGLRPEEVARELGFKPSTLGVRLHRGRKMLADSLAGRGITLSNGILASILAGVVHVGVSDNVVASTSLAAAGINGNGEFVGSLISARVLALTRQAMNAMLWAKAKAVLAALLLSTAALAGTAQAIRTIAPDGLSWRMLDVTRLVRPLLRTLFGRPQFSSALEPAVAPEPLPLMNGAGAHWMPAASSYVRVDPALEPWGASGAADPFVLSQPAPIIDVQKELATSSGGASISLSLAGAEAVAPATRAPAPLTGDAFAAAPVQLAGANVMPAGGFRLDYANRAIYHTAGHQQIDSLVLDSRSSAFTNYVMEGSARLEASRLVVGDVEHGSFDQRGGAVNAHDLIIANRPGSTGDWNLARGARLAVANAQTVGHRGTGRFFNNGGVNVAPTLHIARNRGSRGLYENNGGTLVSDRIEVGVNGNGELINNGGNVTVGNSKKHGVVSIGTEPHGDGQVVLNGGSFTADTLTIGDAGRGRYTQTDGTLFASNIQVGQQPTSVGYASFDGGQVVLKPSGNVVVGGEGVASVTLGDRRGTTTFSEARGNGGTPIVVRDRSTAAGQIRGWGRIDVTGPFTQNGLVIADGFGKSRHLDFSSAARVTNTIDNSEYGGRNGWDAKRGGKLVLPPIYIGEDRTSTWGEDPLDPIPDLINSVRFTVRGVRQPGEAILSLIAPDSPLLPDLPDGETFVGIWGFDRKGLVFEDGDLQVRYDDLLVHELGGDESALRLWTFADGWAMVPEGRTHIDTTLNLLAGYVGHGDFRVFGVSMADGVLPVPSFADAALDNPALATSAPMAIPEPGAAGLVIASACGALLRRRRQPGSSS